MAYAKHWQVLTSVADARLTPAGSSKPQERGRVLTTAGLLLLSAEAPPRREANQLVGAPLQPPVLRIPAALHALVLWMSASDGIRQALAHPIGSRIAAGQRP